MSKIDSHRHLLPPQSISHSKHFKQTQTITQAYNDCSNSIRLFSSEWMSEKHPEILKKVQVTHTDGTPEFIENKMYKNKRAYNRLKKEHVHNSQVDTVKAHNDRLQGELKHFDKKTPNFWKKSNDFNLANCDLNQENAKLQARKPQGQPGERFASRRKY